MMLIRNARLTNETAKNITRFRGILRRSSTWFCLASSLLLSVGSTSVCWGQATSNLELPPPPLPKMVKTQSSVTPTPPITVEVRPTVVQDSKPIKEYTFQAPQTVPAQTIETINYQPPTAEVNTVNTQPISVSKPTGNPSFYRVEVTGKEASLLSQVKAIEPMAFIRQNEGVIHAGMFQHSQQAQKRVQELENKGVTATVVPVYQRKKPSLSVEINP